MSRPHTAPWVNEPMKGRFRANVCNARLPLFRLRALIPDFWPHRSMPSNALSSFELCTSSLPDASIPCNWAMTYSSRRRTAAVFVTVHPTFRLATLAEGRLPGDGGHTLPWSWVILKHESIYGLCRTPGTEASTPSEAVAFDHPGLAAWGRCSGWLVVRWPEIRKSPIPGVPLSGCGRCFCLAMAQRGSSEGNLGEGVLIRALGLT
jgi:hypothetical protein